MGAKVLGHALFRPSLYSCCKVYLCLFIFLDQCFCIESICIYIRSFSVRCFHDTWCQTAFCRQWIEFILVIFVVFMIVLACDAAQYDCLKLCTESVCSYQSPVETKPLRMSETPFISLCEKNSLTYTKWMIAAWTMVDPPGSFSSCCPGSCSTHTMDCLSTRPMTVTLCRLVHCLPL